MYGGGRGAKRDKKEIWIYKQDNFRIRLSSTPPSHSLLWMGWILNEKVQIPERVFQAKKTWNAKVLSDALHTYIYFLILIINFNAVFILYRKCKWGSKFSKYIAEAGFKKKPMGPWGTFSFLLFMILPPKTKTSFPVDHYPPQSLPKNCYPYFSLTWLTPPSQTCISSTRLNNHKYQITVRYKLIKFIILRANSKEYFRVLIKDTLSSNTVGCCLYVLLKWKDIVMHSKINGKCIWSYFIFLK